MLHAGSSFLKLNRPPARIHESVGHSEWIESDITIWTQLEFQLNLHSRYSNWSVSEDVKQRAQNCLQFSRTEQFEELLLAWMRTVLKHSSFSLRLRILVLEQKNGLEIACRKFAAQNAVVKFW
jgi:hypothetical protein